MKTKLESALIMLDMAKAETDDAKRDALLVGIHHTLRRKLHQDRNRFSRAVRKHLTSNIEAMGDSVKEGRARSVESGTVELKLEVRCGGVASVARQIGCHPGHLSYILHGHRKANETLRRRLARMGITTTVTGEAL